MMLKDNKSYTVDCGMFEIPIKGRSSKLELRHVLTFPGQSKKCSVYILDLHLLVSGKNTMELRDKAVKLILESLYKKLYLKSFDETLQKYYENLYKERSGKKFKKCKINKIHSVDKPDAITFRMNCFNSEFQ